MSDNIAVMNNGRVEQIGSPREIYDSPRTQFVANFIGETNLLIGRREDLDRFLCKDLPSVVRVESEEKWTGEGVLSVRPERVSIGPDLKGLDNVFDATVEDMVYQGSCISATVKASRELVMRIRANPTVALEVGKRIRVGWNKADATVIRLANSE
jgi:ABC-type Fe3+/spermidine/putrescine transport system ATPase subunit